MKMADTISYGAGRRVITPEVPASLAGYFNIRMYEGVTDDLEVRAIVFRDGAQGKQIFLLLQFDLITVSECLYKRLIKSFSDAHNGLFTEENVLFTATHTHTAPDYRPDCQVRDERIANLIIERALEAVSDALKDNRSGVLYSGTAKDNRFQFNRRYWMKNGKVVTNPGKFNPEIDRSEGETDYEIPIIAIKSNDRFDVVLAGIVNHTDTIGDCLVSADWAGVTHRALEKHNGEGSIMFPIIGASGNINHFDVASDINQTCRAEAERVGNGYAETIINALDTLKVIEKPSFKTLFAKVETGPSDVSEQEVAEACEVIEKYKDIPDPAESGMTITSEDLANGEPVALKYFAKRLTAAAQDRANRTFRLSGIDFGKCVIASLPSEPFVEIGLELRKRIFKGKTCIVASHGNGTGAENVHGGYIPNPWNYGRGGYETEVLSNPFARDTAIKLIEGWESITK